MGGLVGGHQANTVKGQGPPVELTCSDTHDAVGKLPAVQYERDRPRKGLECHAQEIDITGERGPWERLSSRVR